MVVGVLISKPGITSASTLSIPKDWSPSWFRNLIENQLKGADVRNAVGSGGIQVSGNIASPYATIGFTNPVTLPGPVTITNTSTSSALTIQGSEEIFPPLTPGFGSTGVNSIRGYSFINPGLSAVWYPLFILPASTNSSFDSVTILGELNIWGSNSTTLFSLTVGNRNGFTWRLNVLSGQPLSVLSPQIAIQAFSQVNGTVIVYLAVTASTFSTAAFDLISMMGVTGPGVSFWNPEESIASRLSSTPAGTLVATSATAPQNTRVWNAANLNANISNFGGGFNAAAYLMDGDGKVYIRGLVTGAGLTVPGNIFTLPVAFAPPAIYGFAAVGRGTGGNGIWRINVSPSGVVSIDPTNPVSGTGNPTEFLFLDGVSFYTY